MTERQSTDQRQIQIVTAMLDLLADLPVEAITTRQIARRVGISQPALFRHFRSRDEILAAVVAHTRTQLGRLAEQIVTEQGPAADVLEPFARGLFAYIERHPGLPRVLFHDAAGAGSPRIRSALQALVAMQRGLVTELVRAEGHSSNPEEAGRLFVALVQGLLLQWQLERRAFSLVEAAKGLVAFWAAGLTARPQPAPTQEAAPNQAAPNQAAPAQAKSKHLALLHLDVRPLLAAGADPLAQILATLGDVASNGILKITAPFRPAPLLALLAARGYRVQAREIAPSTWDVEISGPDAPPVVDLTDLEAPGPMAEVLIRTANLAAGEAFLARVPRVPLLLLPRLAERGLVHAVLVEADGTALLHVSVPR